MIQSASCVEVCPPPPIFDSPDKSRTVSEFLPEFVPEKKSNDFRILEFVPQRSGTNSRLPTLGYHAGFSTCCRILEFIPVPPHTCVQRGIYIYIIIYLFLFIIIPSKIKDLASRIISPRGTGTNSEIPGGRQ